VPPCKGATHEPAKRFVRPTVEDVQAYCIERKNAVDAVKFWNFYEAKGWMIGRNHMKSWKAAVHTWEHQAGFLPDGGKQTEWSPALQKLMGLDKLYKENPR